MRSTLPSGYSCFLGLGLASNFLLSCLVMLNVGPFLLILFSLYVKLPIGKSYPITVLFHQPQIVYLYRLQNARFPFRMVLFTSVLRPLHDMLFVAPRHMTARHITSVYPSWSYSFAYYRDPDNGGLPSLATLLLTPCLSRRR